MLFVTQNVLQSFHPCFFCKVYPDVFRPCFFITHLFSHILFSPNFFPPILVTHIFHPYFLQSFTCTFFTHIFFSTKCFLQDLNLILFHLSSLVIGILLHILFFHPCFFIHTFKKVFTCTFSPILFSPIPFYKVFTYTLLQSFYPYFSPIFSIHTFYKVCTHTFFHPSLITHTFYTLFLTHIFSSILFTKFTRH